jgi:DNA-binding beta-propeller fold protein YncE
MGRISTKFDPYFKTTGLHCDKFAYPYSVTVEPSGRFAYVANYQSEVSAYTISASTGALTSIGSTAAGPYNSSVATTGTVH